MTPAETRPDWPGLHGLAAQQAGLFSTSQARRLGFSPELLIYHVHAGALVRVRRGVYRVRHFPPQDDEQLVALWLWSGQEAVISHLTALVLHDLSDVLPNTVDLTLPADWERRRLVTPLGARLHFADLTGVDRTWVGHVPVTSIARTLRDCAALPLSPDLLEQAVSQALARGLVGREELDGLDRRQAGGL